MIQMLFFVRFRGQLRRTKPGLIASLENSVIQAASASGGRAENGRKILTASFDDNRIGFWVDMLIFIEKAHKALSEAAGELYGYTLVLGEDISEASEGSSAEGKAQRLCRSLSEGNESGGTGIWCSAFIRKALSPYMRFEGKDEFWEFRDFKKFGEDQRDFPFRERLADILENEQNTLILGPPLVGKRDGIYNYCAGFLGAIPPLAIRFGAGGRSLICFADAYTPAIQSLISGVVPSVIPAERAEELKTAAALLFGERLREEWSPYMTGKSRAFLRTLMSMYIAATRAYKKQAVLIIENLSLADAPAVAIFREAYNSLNEKKELRIIGADDLAAGESRNAGTGEVYNEWEGIFKKTVEFNSVDFPAPAKMDTVRDMPAELWELAYNICILGRYFPVYLFPKLFENEGLNTDIYVRAVKMLYSLGMITEEDPRNRIPEFIQRCERVLKNRKDKISAAVRQIILEQVKTGSIKPCFNLLRILSELGQRANDFLVLKSLKADVLNGTWTGIEDALGKRHFALLVGTGNAGILRYIYKTLKALVWGSREEIEQTFEEPVPSYTMEDGKPCCGAFQTQIQTNLTSYYIGRGNIEAASEEIRKAMILNRTLGAEAVPAYRLFALVNFSRQRTDDALEYISFAVTEAEKLQQLDELTLTCYYAASINFFYGNISKAERLIRKTEENAVKIGQSGWAAKARFFRGRLNFEMGRYDAALELFESLYNQYDSGNSEMAGTVRAWAFRAKVFLGNIPEQVVDHISAGLDERIFEIEAAYHTGDYEKTVQLANDFLEYYDKNQGRRFVFTEKPDWRSGFDQCECMFTPEKFTGRKMVWVFRSIAQCALHRSKGEKKDVLEGMQRFMRDELLPDTDPQDAFYFYSWYNILMILESAQLDINTVLSMANKRLQRRAERIDDNATKQTFMALPRWNNILYLAARDYKII